MTLGPRNAVLPLDRGWVTRGVSPAYTPGAAVASSGRKGNTVRGCRLRRGTRGDSSPGAAPLQEG